MNSFRVPPRRRFVRESRPLDFIYDPVYTVPSKVDFYKSADYGSRHGESKLKLQTNFPVMFSDVRTDRRVNACMAINQPDYAQKFLPNYRLDGLPVAPMDVGPPYELHDDVTGAQRAKFFIKYVPLESESGSISQLYRLASSRGHRAQHEIDHRMRRDQGVEPEFQDRAIQTDLREVETQTDPYSPSYVLPSPDDYPVVLGLIKMTWGKGLPATLDDIITIERALTRRLLEIDDKKGSPADSADFKKRTQLMEKLEAQQWEDRERELERIRRLKQDIVSKRLTELQHKLSREATFKLERIFEKRKRENSKKLNAIKMDYLRQLRKLERKLTVRKRTFKRDIILDYIDMESAIYAPLVRNGPNIDQLHTAPDYQFTVHRDYETLTYLTEMDSFVKKHMEFDVKEFANQVRAIKPTRRTRMLERKLHDCLKAFQNVCAPKGGDHGEDEMLNSMIMKSVRRLSTPEEIIPQDEEPDFDDEAIVILQALIRGRAVQTLLRQEARQNMNTILQLKAAYETDPYGALQPISEKMALRRQQAEQEGMFAADKDVTELVEQIEGDVLAHMMSFLEKEMTRLLDERKIHALILLAERERRMLEASEAGRRQREEENLRANDEMWRQIVGIHQSTVDMYLEDIYLETINRSADDDARMYVQQLARTINDTAFSMEKNIRELDKDDIAADLVHSFLFPQVKREKVQHQMIDLHGRYYTAATQVTESLLNAKGFVHEVLEILQPELKKRLQQGSETVDASYCAVQLMIRAAVEQVVKREGEKLAKSEEADKTGVDDGQENPELLAPPPLLLENSEEAPTEFNQKATPSRPASGKALSEQTLSRGQANMTTSKSDANVAQLEPTETAKSSRKPATGVPQTPKSEEISELIPETQTPGRVPRTRMGTANIVDGNPDVPDSKDLLELEEPTDAAWNIPIEVPPMLCDLLGLKKMELESGRQELAETTVKVFDAACTTVAEVFEDVHTCFTQSDEGSDQELDDDDPDQD